MCRIYNIVVCFSNIVNLNVKLFVIYCTPGMFAIKIREFRFYNITNIAEKKG